MRIGIMLRALRERGGIGVYAKNIVAELLRRDPANEYVLFYWGGGNGRSTPDPFAGYPNVQERLIQAPNKALWDQVAIPLACRREQVDVLFHPKFTAPLLAPCPVVMTVHGADWFIPDQAQYYRRLDVAYVRLMMPLYFKKCETVISVSQLTTDNFKQVLRLPPDKLQTIYFAPARQFQRVTDPTVLRAVQARYQLPGRFILTLTKRLGGERKNLGHIFKAYARYHERVSDPFKLVVGGKDCHLYKAEYGIPDNGYGADILFPGWIDQQDLPAVYSQADLYLYPSNVEAFPIPLTEAMACGTAILTSNVNGLAEIAGDAAWLVDPGDSEAIASALHQLLCDPDLRQTLSLRGMERSRRYNWDNCASQTLAVLQAAAGQRD